MLAAALPMVFTSCGDENDDTPVVDDKPVVDDTTVVDDKPVVNDTTVVTLDQVSMTLDYSKEATLKASEKNCTWLSSNPFVATVDSEGKVTAKHVGEAVISASKDGSTAKCNVVVKATNNNFVMPIITWGSSMDDVKTGMTSLNIPGLSLSPVNVENSLVYTMSGEFPFYIYSFTDNKLSASSLTVDEEMDESADLEEYLDQRYKYFDETEEGFLYGNADDINDATLLIVYGMFDGNIMAIWTAPRTSKAGEVSFNAAAANANRQVIRQVLKAYNK